MKSNKEIKLEEALALVNEVAAYDEALKPVAAAIKSALVAKADEEFEIWWTQNCNVVLNVAHSTAKLNAKYWKAAQLAWRAAKEVK